MAGWWQPWQLAWKIGRICLSKLTGWTGFAVPLAALSGFVSSPALLVAAIVKTASTAPTHTRDASFRRPGYDLKKVMQDRLQRLNAMEG